MKKSILLLAMAIFGFTSTQAQQGTFSAGIDGGIPVGDVEEFTTFNLGANIGYRFALAEQFELGAVAAYSHFFGDKGEEGGVEWEVDDFQFLPLAASGRFKAADFFAGADVGYAIGINDGNEGGFYYRPHAGYDFGKLALVASYSGISRESVTVSSVNLGIEFNL